MRQSNTRYAARKPSRSEWVEESCAWILSHIAKEVYPEAAPKRFVSGETLPYLGRNVRMIIESQNSLTPKVRLDHWRFIVSAPTELEGNERYEKVRGAFIAWYRERASERLVAGVDRWWSRLGRDKRQRILIRDLRLRRGRNAALQLACGDAAPSSH